MNLNLINFFDQSLKESSLSRRDALKLLSTSALGATFIPKESEASTFEEIKVNIVVVGAGLAGMATASRLNTTLPNSKITIIEPNKNSCSYQSGLSLFAVDFYEKEDILFKTKNFIHKNINVIWEKVNEFNPNSNQLLLSNNKKISYDFLVIAAGVVLDFKQISGLEELDEIASLKQSKQINSFFKNNKISSIYNIDTAEQTSKHINDLIVKAKKGKKIDAVFTQNRGRIKAESSSKEIMYLMNAKLVANNARKNIDMNFYLGESKLFPIKEYEDVLINHMKKRDMNYHLSSNLKKINLKEKTVTFEKSLFEDKVDENKSIEIIKPYDFLHITPPMNAIKEIRDSELSSKNGYASVNKESLQHTKFDNIFALGDIIDTPLGKTAQSVRIQYKILVQNIIDQIKNKEPSLKYDGHTSSSIITDFGKAIEANYDWSMEVSSNTLLNSKEDRYIWWFYKAYLAKPMMKYGLLHGRI